ncbi:DUF433 domain-containing protein [Halomicronema sp. CCY15110]|uniref:DUF433 domain-containing protein n=1 Tax=Halomicronema sp. CCY15110 TaxID=2767773 RepID=UPI001950EE82|nr:DUF433 domain-containing protein [Halomicronema sp. CCY15110]
MNPKLVESLVEAVQSLPPEDYALFQTTLSDRLGRKTPRIAVWTLSFRQKQGADEAELRHNFPGLTPLDLVAARAYYVGHPEEIDNLMASRHDKAVGAVVATPALTMEV